MEDAIQADKMLWNYIPREKPSTSSVNLDVPEHEGQVFICQAILQTQILGVKIIRLS